MHLTCRHCQQAIEVAERQPSECPACGRPLHAAVDDATLDYLPTRDADKTPLGDEGGGQWSTSDERIGEYRLQRPLGHGGMGTVWEAEQAGTGRRVALKLLSPRLSPTPENVDRFLREGKLAASVSHPRSTFVFGAGQQSGQPYIAMELMPGRTLKDVLDEEGPLPVERAVDYILDVIDGLEAAHAMGVIHRDVKPSNCFLDGDGRAKVGDFGLSKSLVSDAGLTKTGAFLGTPQFAAPEQAKGGAVDQRTDVYGVGATLFCLLAGRAPFEGDAVSVIAQIASDAAPRLSSFRADVRQAMERIVARSLEKDPARRFSDLAGLRRALFPFASGGVSIANVGRRFAAYTLDSLIIGMCGAPLALGIAICAYAGGIDPNAYDSATLNAWLLVVFAAAPFCYFSLTEGLWGRGLGKRLMGLWVVGPDGDRPSYARSFLRSFFVPGALGLVVLPGILERFFFTEVQPRYGLNWRVAALNYMPYLVFLLCTTSMRALNGYRGWHELASGTRVVRLRKAVAIRRQRVPTVLPVPAHDEPFWFGPFKSAGELGRSGELRVSEARDELLGRAVWVYRGPRAAMATDARRMVVRATRPHWLQGGELAGDRWDAFEAVSGAPLTEIAREPEGAAWQDSRHWLLDLCEELTAAMADDTLPDELSLEQIWIARGGRLKLLDTPLTPLSSSLHDAARYTGPAADRALALLRASVALCTRRQILPPHALAFADQLAPSALADRDALARAAKQLREVVKQPAALGWDDRLGILAVSMGTELSFYGSVAFLFPWLLFGWLQWPMERLAAVVPLALFLPALVGFLFRGGPAFWLTKIAVLRSDGRRAGRWRCGWRSFIAWTPILFLYVILGLIVAKNVPLMGTAGQQTPGDQLKPHDLEAWLLLGGACGGELLALAFLVGAVYALVRPRRGLQDLLSGTWLAPH